jgi:hypothetical protein
MIVADPSIRALIYVVAKAPAAFAVVGINPIKLVGPRRVSLTVVVV